MAVERRRARLGDVADVGWGDTSTTKASYVPDGVQAYSATGPDGYLPEAQFDRTGVVVSAIGAQAGKTWLARGRWSTIKNTIRFWATDPQVDTEYLYWLTCNPDFWPKRGSAQPFISQGDARNLIVSLPPLDEQRRIAHILGTLDDKIELNRRMSQTLEEMARALFKSWFVDFDPVRAKAEGRDTGLPKHLADLFPDRLVDSDLGEIPEGWATGPLGDFFNVGLGGAWGESARSDKAPAEVRCLRGIDLHDLAEGRIPDVPTRWLSPRQAEARAIPDGTILVEGSGSFCGRSLLWGQEFSDAIDGLVVYSNFCKRLDPLVTKDQAAVVWMQMRTAYSSGILQSFRTGTAFPNFDIHGLLSNFWVTLPPPPIASAYAAFGGLRRSMSGSQQAITLGAIRDALLVKTISAESILGD